jgi:hypothetical protein
MGKVKIYILCSIFCLSFSNLCFAEIIMLKSGQQVEGRIIEQTDKYVKLDFQGVEVVYLYDEITAIHKTDPEGSLQLETIHKAYTASLNSPSKTKEDNAKENLVSPKSAVNRYGQVATDNQSYPASMPTPDSLLPGSEYQKMIKSALTNLPVLKKPAKQLIPANAASGSISNPDLSQAATDKDDLQTFKLKGNKGY